MGVTVVAAGRLAGLNRPEFHRWPDDLPKKNAQNEKNPSLSRNIPFELPKLPL